MLYQALAHEMLSSTQFDRMVKSLDEWLQIYSEAILVLFVLVLSVLTLLVVSEMRQSKSTKKTPSNHKALKEYQLLQTEP